jgi:hypothetical protein
VANGKNEPVMEIIYIVEYCEVRAKYLPARAVSNPV